MAQGSRQIQSQAQQQIQTLSPQQILVVKLLELPAVELEDRVHAELLENPALEEGKEESTSDETTPAETSEGETEGDTDYDSLSDYLTEDDIPDYKLQENNRSKGEQAEEIPFSDATSFYEILREQLGERNLTEHQRELAEYLIGSLDDDGLLRKSLESIGDELAIYAGINATEEELEEALRIVQDFDPPGLGARSLQECLLIQIRRKKQSHCTDPLLETEEEIISECYEEFTRKHWEKIIKKLGLDEEHFYKALEEITKLNPRPGASLGEAIGRNLQQIVPDFIVDTYDDGTINISLNNRNLPEHEIKIILNRYLFPASEWDKSCRKLSGGEKMRLAFCCLMISNNTPDMFILDEPTNNLDIQSIDIITATIRNYTGTVIAISHDNYFIREIGIEQRIVLS